MGFREMRDLIAKKDANLWVSLFLLIFSVGVANEAYRLGLGDPHSPGPGFMFFGASSILGLLAIHLFFKSLLAMEHKGEKSVWRRKRLGRSGSFFVALLLYNFLLEPVGYLLTTFFFLSFLFWVTREEGKGKKGEWVLILGGAALTSFLSYLIFSRLFMLMFPKGLIKFI